MVTSWSNPGQVITVRQVAELFGKTFIQAATMNTAVNAFRKCGIVPYDITVFSETDFLPATTTDIELPQNDKQDPLASLATTDSQRSVDDINNRQPGCSFWTNDEQPTSAQEVDTSFKLVSPRQLILIPRTTQKQRMSRKRGKTAIITSSPYKIELEENIKKRLEAEQDKENKRK